MLDLKEIKLEVFDQWGFVDRLMIRGDKAHLVDYKFGFNFKPILSLLGLSVI